MICKSTDIISRSVVPSYSYRSSWKRLLCHILPIIILVCKFSHADPPITPPPHIPSSPPLCRCCILFQSVIVSASYCERYRCLFFASVGDPKRNHPLIESPPGGNISSPPETLFQLNAKWIRRGERICLAPSSRKSPHS